MNNINQQNQLAKAILIASEGHMNVLDQGGNAYILHPIQVMYNLNTDDAELKQIAILHDVIEDCTKYIMKKHFMETLTEESAHKHTDTIYSNSSVEKRIDISLEILKHWGFSDRVIKALKLMTKLSSDKGEEGYFNYIRRMFNNIDAIRVKMADIRHNSDLLRMKGTTKKDLSRTSKYAVAFGLLNDRLKEVCVNGCSTI